MMDSMWPCREPLLDDALDKLLAPNSSRMSDILPPSSVTSGDGDRFWEEEDGIYPDLSQDGTLTPMTDSSWMDECFTPSTCPGTPDATLDLPAQQPSAVDRLSASGQVGLSTGLSQNKLSITWPKTRFPHNHGRVAQSVAKISLYWESGSNAYQRSYAKAHKGNPSIYVA